MRSALLLTALLPTMALAQLSPPPPPPDIDAKEETPSPQKQRPPLQRDYRIPEDDRPMEPWVKRPTATEVTERTKPRERPGFGLRAVTLFGGGLAGGLLGASAGWASGCALQALAGQPSRCDTFGPYLTIGVAALGIPTGIILSGRALGEDSSLLATVGGYLLGGAALIPSVMLITSLQSTIPSSSTFIPGFVVLVSLLPFAGAIAGHELSHTEDVTPTVALGPGGGSAGFSVRF